MQIGVIGINHKLADLGLREAFAKACAHRLQSSSPLHHPIAYVLLSTCNRTEVYFSSSDLAATHTYFLGLLRSDVDYEFEHKLYSYFGGDCFFHLARVTSGMDSAIIGETEIQGQVKRSYELAATTRFMPQELHFLFQKCLKIGKQIRSNSNEFRGMPTLEEAVLNAGYSYLGDLKRKHILFVGVSEINHKIHHRFKQKGFANITFCNRTEHKAQVISLRDQIKLLRWNELSRWTGYDLIILGTKSPKPLISIPPVDQSFLTQKLVIDLSVPRNVCPGNHSQVSLLNIDQINLTIDRKQKVKASEIAHIEAHDIAIAVTSQVKIFQKKQLHFSIQKTATNPQSANHY